MLDEIVLIDDDKTITAITKKAIQKLLPNVPVKTFENGEKGLVYLISVQDANLRTLIFLDLNMPIMDGFQFLSVYENAIAYQDHAFAICLLTASALEEDQQKATQFSSILEYVHKPLKETTLKGIVERAVQFLDQKQILD